MLNSIRKWLIEILGGRMPTAVGKEKNTIAEEVSFRELSSAVVLDDPLLERCRIQWYFGDWSQLASLQHETFQNHPQRATLALFAAAGRLQNGADVEARKYIMLAKEWGCTNILLSQILISGVHNSIGRAASIFGDHARAVEHYGASVATASPGNDARLLTQARVSEQFTQLGLVAASQISNPRVVSANQHSSINIIS